MKKILLSLLAIAAVFVSCKKEASSIEPEQSSKTITIAASCDDVTKSTYTEAGVFSWVYGDEIAYIIRNTSDNKYNNNTLSTTATTGSTNATFSGSTTATGYSAVDLAFYPKIRQSGIYISHDAKYVKNSLAVVSATTLQATLQQPIAAYDDRLQGIVPMIGKKTGEDGSGTVEKYHFSPVTGILKVSFTDLPATATEIHLDMPDNSTYALNGNFNIDTTRDPLEIKASDCAGTKWGQKYLKFVYASASDAFYFPIPTGTIPAGKLTVSVSDGTNILHSVICKQEIVLTRGEITELPTISVCPVTVTASGTSSAIIANLTFEAPTAKAKVVLAESIDAGKTLIDINDAAVQTLTGTGSTSALSTSNISGSKKCYIVVRTYNTSDQPKGTVVIPVYSLSSSDTALLGHYTHATEASCKQGGSVAIPNPASFTIVASNNPTICNMMVSEFDGMTCTNKVPGIYDPTYTKVTWDNFNKPFDTNSPAKRFARSSGMDTKLNFVFTLGTPNTFYADANFGYVTGDSSPWTWQYYYNAGSGHVYTQQLP